MSKKTRQQIRREVLRHLKNNGKKAFRAKELSNRLGFKDNATYALFRDVLDEMGEQDLIGRAKGGRYTYKPRPTRVEGKLHVNRQGFGFVEVEGMEEDLFVRESNLSTALDGDVVRVGLFAPSRGDRRRECEVLEIVERVRNKTVGTFKRSGHFAFVVPDDARITQDIYVPKEDFNGAEDGDKVVVSIDRFEDRKASPEGRVLTVVGPGSDPAVQVLALAMSMDVRSGFPDEVEKDAAALPDVITEDEIARRIDLRTKRVFTIDPDDAQDFDDAIHVELLEDDTYEVGVHIADVAHYVRPGTALDEEAYARGNSVYLVDRVIPMLPEKLSNRVCSLRPHEDKLTYSCIMNVTKRGRVISARVFETVIHSHHRFTYDEAQAFIDGGFPEHPFASDVVEAARLARTLTKKRMREGSVDFDLPEIKVLLGDDGEVDEIVRKERMEANRLVEEYMLLANRSISEMIAKKKGSPPFIYRIHDTPDADRIKQLSEYVRAFGYSLDASKDGEVSSKALNALIEHIKDTPEEPVIENAALRAMAKAVYSPNNIGHYGLGFKYYSHFTSPIRRYPDLIAHRLLKRYTKGGGATDAENLESSCRHLSERERAAVSAERESVKLKQVEYIRQHLGEHFAGVVSGVTKFGVFVEMSDVLVEGLVHVRDLDDDYYEYDEARYALVGRDTGRTYKPGDRVEVQVTGANVETREVDLLFV